MVVSGTQRKFLTLNDGGAGSSVENGRTFGDSFDAGLVIRTKTLDGAAGSAYVEAGETKVVCSVNGPKEQLSESMEGVLNVSLNGAESSLRHTILSTLKSVVCLKKIARTEVDVELNVLVSGDEVLAAALMAASCALITANVECFDIVLARQFAVASDGQLVAGTSADDNAVKVAARVTMAIAPALAQLVCVDVGGGAVSADALKKALSAGFDKCLELYEPVSTVLHEWASKSL